MSDQNPSVSEVITKTLEIMGISRVMHGYASDGFFGDIENHIANNPGLIEQVCKLQPGSVFLDVGANIGGTALIASSTNSRIIGIEASPRNAYLFEQTMRANGVEAELFHCAAGQGPGEIRFNESEYGAGSHIDEAGTIVVQVRSIDSIVAELGLERVDLIKIDVEGYELEVLLGALDTLTRFRPTVIMEFNAFAITMHTQASPRKLADLVLSLAGSFVVDGEDGFLVNDEKSLGIFMYQHMIHGSVNDLLWRPVASA